MDEFAHDDETNKDIEEDDYFIDAMFFFLIIYFS